MQLKAALCQLCLAHACTAGCGSCRHLFLCKELQEEGEEGWEGGREGGDCPGCCPPRHTYKHPHSLPPSFPALLGGVITVPIIIHASQRCSHAGRDVDAHKQPKSPAHLGVASEHKGPSCSPALCTLFSFQTPVVLDFPTVRHCGAERSSGTRGGVGFERFSRTKVLPTLCVSGNRTRYCCYAAGLLVLSCC